jgi:hypothetical protein
MLGADGFERLYSDRLQAVNMPSGGTARLATGGPAPPTPRSALLASGCPDSRPDRPPELARNAPGQDPDTESGMHRPPTRPRFHVRTRPRPPARAAANLVVVSEARSASSRSSCSGHVSRRRDAGVIVAEQLGHPSRTDRHVDADRNGCTSPPTLAAFDLPEAVRPLDDNWLMRLHSTPHLRGLCRPKRQTLANRQPGWASGVEPPAVGGRPAARCTVAPAVPFFCRHQAGNPDDCRRVGRGWAKRPLLGGPGRFAQSPSRCNPGVALCTTTLHLTHLQSTL